MTLAREIAALIKRDLSTLLRHVEAFPSDEMLWQLVPGVANSAGNLILHLEGNLREYVGRQLGNIPYTRDRDGEFGMKSVGKNDLVRRLEGLVGMIPAVITSLSPAQLESMYPEAVLERELTVHGFLVHLYGHLGWHMGQIDYLRRVLTAGGAVQRVPLQV
jgi:hypothetical protein